MTGDSHKTSAAKVLAPRMLREGGTQILFGLQEFSISKKVFAPDS
jgi:hypothetical protein